MKPLNIGFIISTVISLMVIIAGAAGKIAKIAASQEILKESLRAAIRSQEARISRLESAQLLKKPDPPKPPDSPRLPE